MKLKQLVKTEVKIENTIRMGDTLHISVTETKIRGRR